ncbi:MAG: tetratricopeptide repeat protein, partial [Xanthomonadales bacterium]|nr:tetratricopeptide repeat protein [Xanthomonadales bacterium]
MTEQQESSLGNLWQELKRRRVIRVVVLYAIAGWVVIEVFSTVAPNLNLPDWSVTLVTVLVVLGFVLAIILAWAFDIGPGGIHKTSPAVVATESAAESEGDSKETGATRRREDARRTIAVLPFVNMSGEEENEYFSDGVAEEILNLLTRLPQLRVSSRSSSFAYKGEQINIRKVAEDLEVSTLLEGSVRRAGDRVRITAQLIDTATDSHLWSETYDREMKDVFEIQDDIAQSIVKTLEVTLTPRDRRALQYVATSDAKAYDYYLRGRKFFYTMTKRAFHHAVKMYRQAIAEDPSYALAYAGIADAHSFLYMYGDSTPANAGKAQEASNRAVELDPDSAEAHASRGIALSISKRYDEAQEEFETAIRLNSKLFEAHYFYARDCFAQGKFEQAAELFAAAATVNPTDYQSPSFQSMALKELARPEEATAASFRAYVAAEKHLELHPDDARAMYLGSAALVEIGEYEKAATWAERALDTDRNEPAVLYNVACAYSLMGDIDRSIGLLEEAVNNGFGYRAWLENDNTLANLRGDPRFDALLKR